MNWYKKAQIETELGYFQELSDKDEYVPKVNPLKEKLEKDFGVRIVSKIGQGDSGQAYLLSDGNVLKITTNNQEGKNAKWLKDNPHPNIAKYDEVWKDGNLFYIIMERLDFGIPNMVKRLITFLSRKLDEYNCYSPICAIEMLKKTIRTNTELEKIPEVMSVMSYLKHISSLKAFDFLNPNNIGIKNGRLKFFDVN